MGKTHLYFHTMTHSRFFLSGASALSFLALLAGCQSRSPDAVLLKKDPGSSVTYRAPGENDVPYATNVVHVPRDARFSLSLEALNPGWLHADNARHAARTTPAPFASDDSLAGKDLWLLIHIRTLSSNDALQTETKRISRASLVKYDVRSFGLIPLTVDEATPFALEANTDYEVEVRLYDVKKSFQRAQADTRPGLTGVARTAWDTTTDTFKALVGDSATSTARATPSGDLPVERQLLDAGGTLRFNARFAIYRSNDTLAPRLSTDDARGRTLINRYQLIDPDNRRTTDHSAPRFTDSASYLEQLNSLENAETPGRQDAFLRFRVESMWSPVARELALIAAAPASPETVSEEQALAAESLANTARENFLKVAEEEKQARFTATESLRKSDGAPSADIEETARNLSRKTLEVAAARTAMETAQARARETRLAVTASASRAAESANAEKTVELANTALDQARRSVDAAVNALDEARDALRRTREAAEAARLKKEEWLQSEARAQSHLDEARTELAAVQRKADKKPDDTELRAQLTAATQAVADAVKFLDTSTSEWKLAQKDQEAKLREAEDRLETVAQRRLSLAEAESERQRLRTAKDQADSVLQGTDATDPRPAILRARSL
jgi:hypothetical protein